jgi:hypothetical protein
MKKYLIGAIFGIVLSFSVSVYAEEVKSLIGRAIEGQFPVKVDDKQLDNQAIVIDGTSYLPVRAIGDALNMEVGFNADLGITLKSKPKPVEEAKPTVTPSPTPTVLKPEDIERLYPQNTSNKELNKINEEIVYWMMLLNVAKKSRIVAASDSEKEVYTDRIVEYETKIADLEAKKAALENPLYSAPGQASNNPLQE